MAIQPIDLQTIFTQVDKVGKTQNAMQDGLSVQQALQGAKMEQKTEQRIQSVNEAQNTGDGIENIKDRRGQQHEQAEGENGEQEAEEDAAPDSNSSVIRDPRLGKNIDISL